MIYNLPHEEALSLCEDFLQHARTGERATASTGERAAFRVLNQLRTLSADWEDMDQSSRMGAVVVLDMLASPDLRQIILRRLP